MDIAIVVGNGDPQKAQSVEGIVCYGPFLMVQLTDGWC